MDQFGIGLVGMRTPYGAARPSSMTITFPAAPAPVRQFRSRQGSPASRSPTTLPVPGRVPAGFNNIVGIKPTPGIVSNACVSGGGCVKTIETVSVFALTVEDGMAVMRVITGYDPSYPFSKPEADHVPLDVAPAPPKFRFGIPAGAALRFFGDTEAERLFQEAVERLDAMGGELVEIDFTPSRKPSAFSMRAHGFPSGR